MTNHSHTTNWFSRAYASATVIDACVKPPYALNVYDNLRMSRGATRQEMKRLMTEAMALLAFMPVLSTMLAMALLAARSTRTPTPVSEDARAKVVTARPEPSQG
ncbi:MAG: hypothetical protein HXY34_03530 [Candidatus Thorarchaeota archaeon]|nr:hypothetical protein [Candidatus Thorarchaeota archaeon]